MASFYENLLEKRKGLHKSQHGNVSLFWDTNITAVTSCENTLQLKVLFLIIPSHFLEWIFTNAYF